MPDGPSVAIVGGGVIGLCAAYELAKQGVSVVVLDANEPGAESCSTGNAGMVVPSHFVPLAAPGMAVTGIKMMRNPKSPFGFRMPPSYSLMRWAFRFLRSSTSAHVEASAEVLRDLNLESRRLYLGYHEQLEGIGLEIKGLLMIAEAEETLRAEVRHAEKASTLGLEVATLSSDDVRNLEPQAEIRCAGAVLFKDDAHLNPTLLLSGLRRRIQELGGQIRSGARVASFRVAGDRIQALRLEDGAEVSTQEVVLATGVETPHLAVQLGHNAPVVAGKGYSFTLPSPPLELNACAILCEAKVAVTPMASDQGPAIRFAGTMELGADDDQVNPARVQGIRDSVCRVFPQVQSAHVASLPIWQGKRPCTPDGIPMIGRSRRWRNLVFACGHAMMGLSLAPVTGALVAELVHGRTHPLASSLLDPNRFD